MAHKKRSGLAGWVGLAAGAALLALCLILVGGQVAADQGAAPDGPPWRPTAGGGAGAHPLGPTELGDWDGFDVNWPCVISDTGVYRMWYSGYNPGSPGYGWQIGGAESFEGILWTKYPGNPVLGVGEPGEWDEMYRGQAACMLEGGTYKMWFTGGSIGPWTTGYATSSDGIDWNLSPGNPVLPAGGAGSWDEMESSMPTVIKDGGVYMMWYLGCNADYSVCSIGHATSPDGVTWTKYLGNPVLTGSTGQWDEDAVWGPTVIKNGSTYMMWYQSDDEMGLATSLNGTEWTKHAANPVLGEGWGGAGVLHASVLLEGSTYKMWVRSGTGASEGIGYATSDDGITWTMHGGNPVLTRGDAGLFAGVNYDHDWVQVRALPTTTLVITVADSYGAVKATTSGNTGEWGWYGTWDGEWDPEVPDIVPGDRVSASGDGLTTEVDPVGHIDSVIDLDADVVTGTVHADWYAPQPLDVRCEVWAENGPGIHVRDVAADGGSFTCDFGAIGWDLEAWQEVAVRYLEPDGDSVIAMPPRLQPSITADYFDDWVNGEYKVGHTAWITVTESDHSTVKATAEVVSQVYPEWNSWTGFATQGEDWQPMYVDIQPGDWVDVMMDNGYGNQVKVGLIDGGSNVDTDVVSGTIHADWLGPLGLVTVNCEIHEENGPSMQVEDVDPEGGSFECDFSGEWDIQRGHNVAVNYTRPDGGARVQTHFTEPTPNLRLEKWAEGSGEAAPGGRLVYTIKYRNDGNAAAETILLTDTLPADTEYVADSSGEVPVLDGGQVVWTLGPLDAGREKLFHLALSNTANPSDTLTNQADIYTLYDREEDNNHAESEVHVTDGQPDLHVDKNRAGDHPVPGETMLYEINYGNNNEVASGPVWLTDTLPAYTSVYTWWSQNGYDLWQEESRDGELVLTAPSIPGYWGDRLYLRVEVDEGAPYDYELANRVDIYTVGDSDPDNNWHERSDRTGEANANVGTQKQFDWGSTVPGGEVRYWVGVQNYGNVAAGVVLTETLPEGTTFEYAVRYAHQTELPFPPDHVDGAVAVWNLGVMEPGDHYELGVHLGYAGDLVPGTTLENCATAAMDGVHDDEWPYDDRACAQVQIRPAGPNLLVYKRAHWNWEGQLQYEIRFNNVGTTGLEGVVISDTLPVGMSFSGNWWHYFWEVVQIRVGADQLSWTLSRLDPGWGSSIWFEADLDSELIYEQGLAFTNTVEAPLSGDVFPGDNLHQVVVHTGPDLYAEKWVSGGELLPGERITLTVRCGNQSRGPWRVNEEASVRLTERLPEGMTYVGAFWPDGNPNPPDDYEPFTGHPRWDLGSLGSDDQRLFYLVVNLNPDLPLGSVLVNELEVEEVPELDVDPVPRNNTFELRLHVGKPVYLPLVLRTW